MSVALSVITIYKAFKKYVNTEKISLDFLFEDMLKYARIYQKLLNGKSGLNCKRLDDCMYRLNRLEITVTEPFFMEILRLNQDGEKISAEDLVQVFQITENYLFRRNICDVPTNALNKIFLNLNREIIRYDNSTNNYVDKFVYALLSKKVEDFRMIKNFHMHLPTKLFIRCGEDIRPIFLNALKITVH